MNALSKKLRKHHTVNAESCCCSLEELSRLPQSPDPGCAPLDPFLETAAVVSARHVPSLFMQAPVAANCGSQQQLMLIACSQSGNEASEVGFVFGF